ncbi:amidohydrolase family protein [Ottowia thiooxydans]|uniref:amidohydrolase family protein n=1 Tax=Ottowia thiooxydans TaxID=219182 RepID=UPI0004209CDF|nr:amidohydrolase family protein [Ottowia thiooxydans]
MKQSPAVDAHAHIFCGPEHPMSPHRLYTPHSTEMGTADQFCAVLDAHGFSHALLVGAGPYRTDNSGMLAAIAAFPGRFKGIALVEPDIDEHEMKSFVEHGIVGIRVNLSGFGLSQITGAAADRLLAMLKEMGLFLQIICQKDDLVTAMPILRRSGVKVMVDHFGRPDISQGIAQQGFQALLELGRSGNAIVKLSGPFRSSVAGFPYKDVDQFVSSAMDAFTLDRCVWGSDWPFVDMHQRIDYGPTASCIARWLPDVEDRQKVLWDTPARLFGFTA